MEYPELEKMKKIQDESQSIGQFIDWMEQKKQIWLCKYEDSDDKIDPRPMPISQGTQQLLAEYFEIDMVKVEEERRQILEDIRQKNKGE